MKHFLVLILLLLVGTGGCAQGQEKPLTPQNTLNNNSGIQSAITQTTLDIAAIFDNQSRVMKEVKTCRNNLYSKIDFKSSNSSSKNVSIVIDINSDIDISNRLMSSTISSNISMSGKSQKTTQQIIATSDYLYFKEGENSDSTIPWKTKELDKAAADALWNEQDSQITGSKYSGLLSPERFIYTGKETLNGQVCLVLKQSLDSAQILEMAPELTEQMKNAGGFSRVELEEMLKNIEVVFYIDEQSYLREVRLLVPVDQEVEGENIRGTIEQRCLYDKFNEPVSIQVPGNKINPISGYYILPSGGKPMKIMVRIVSIIMALIIMSIGLLSSVAEAKSLDTRQMIDRAIPEELSNKIMDSAISSLLGGVRLDGGDAVMTEGYTELDLNQLMDNCQNEKDSDEDGLPDEVEKVLGTDPEIPDTDEDELSDYYEAAHGLDPLNPDTNNDGVSDYNEILIYGEVEEGKNEEDYLDIDMDTDDDGTPNTEDRDNDGDGVPDGLDISPFSWGDVQEYYEITLNTGPSSTNPKYVDFQIQPENLDDIYNKIQTYDWPYDQEGNIQDSEYSTEDMTVKPMAEVEFNDPEHDLPSDEDCVKYGMIKRDNKLWISLVTVEDNGKKVALAGKIFVAPGDVTTQTLKIRLVWSMEFTNDRGTFQWSKQSPPFAGKKEWQGAGVETYDIDGNGKDDIIVAGIINGTATYNFWYTIGYDMDINGKVKGWSPLKRVPVDMPGNSAGGGVALASFADPDDGSFNDDIDIIFSSVERKDESDQWVYIIGYDLNAWGEPDEDSDGNPRWSRIGYGPEVGSDNSGAGISVSQDMGGTNSNPDIVFMTIDNAEGADVFKYTIFWDFTYPGDYDPDSRNWNTIVQSNPIGWENSGGDVEITNLDSNSRPDLLFLTVDNAEGPNKFRYYVAWNIAGSGSNRGNPTSWSSMNVPPMQLGDRSYGAGLAVTDFNSDGKKDILLLNVDDPGDSANSLWYWIGSDFRGNASWSQKKIVESTEGLLSGGNLSNIRELDCRMLDLDESEVGDMVLGWGTTDGHFIYLIGWDINSNTEALCWSGIKNVSLGPINGQVDGLGFEIYDINDNDKPDIYIVFNDGADGVKTIIGWDLDVKGEVSSWSGIQTVMGIWDTYTAGKGIGVGIESVGVGDAVDVIIASGDCAIVNTTQEQAYEYETDIDAGYDLDHDGRITSTLYDNVMYLRETTSRDSSHEPEDYDNNDKYYQIVNKQLGMGMVMYDFNHDEKSDLLLTSTDDVNENGFRSFMLYNVAKDDSTNRVSNPANSIYPGRNIDAAGGVYPEGADAISDYRKLGLGTCVWDLTDNDNVDGISVMVEKEGDNYVFNIFTANDLETSTLNILEEYVPYRLTGLAIEECEGGEAAVIYNNDSTDLKNNYEDALGTYEILWQYYLNNYKDVERDIQDALDFIGKDNGEDIGDFRQLSVPHYEIMNYDHSDEAQSKLDDKIMDLDDEFNGTYSKLPIITCTTNSARQMTLDNLEQAKITSSKLTFNLENIDFATTKLLQLKCFNFEDDEVVEIDGIVDLVDSNLGAGLADQQKAQLAQILIAHHMGELFMVRIGTQKVIPAMTEKGRIMKHLSGSISTLAKIYNYGSMVYVGAKVTGAIFSGSASIGKFIKNIVSFYKVAYGARMTQGSMWSLRNALDSHNFCGLKGSLASGPTITKLMKWGNNLIIIAVFAMSVYAGYQVAKAYDYTGYGFYAGAVYTVLTFALPLILFLIPKILTAVRAGFVATGFGALIIAVIELSDFITFLCCGKSWSQMAIEAVFNFLVGKGVDVEVDLKAISEDLSYDKMRGGLFVMGSSVRDTSFWKGIVTDINRKYYNSSGEINENYMIPYVLYPQSSYYNTDNKAYDPGNSHAVDGWVPFTTLDNLKSKTSRTSFGYDEVETTTGGLITQTTSYKYDNSLEFKTLKANLPVNIVKEYEYKIHKWKKVMGVYTDDGFINESSSDKTTLYFDVMPSSLKEFEDYYDVADQYAGGAATETQEQSRARMTANKTIVVQRDPDGDGLPTYGEHEKNKDGDILETAYNTWDSDDDGVGDALEDMLDMDPLVTDTDSDGLTDLDELKKGTDPCKADSDGDTLTDKEEIDGWSITLHFNGVDIATHVSSNPLVKDTDGDGLTDKEEYDGGTNPGSKFTPGRTLPDGERWELLWDGNQYAPSIEADIPDNYDAQNNTEYSFNLDDYFQDNDTDTLSYTADTGEISDRDDWKYTYSYTGTDAPVIKITVTAKDDRGTAEIKQSFILADTTSPVLKQATVVIRDGSNYYPFDRLEEAQNVYGLDPDITVIYNEPVIIGDNFTGILLKDASGVPVACTNTVGSDKIFVTPDAALIEDKNSYTLMVPAGAVEDSAGNPSENGYEGAFITQDITPPQVISWPSDTVGVGPYDEMTVTFQEDIIRAWPYVDAYAVQTIGLSDVRVSDVNFRIDIENRTTTFTLGADRTLDDNKTYKIKMDPGFVKDNEGNNSDTIEFTFTTGDVHSPVLIPEAWEKVEDRFLIDVDNATPVIELTYSEDLAEGVNFANIRLEQETKQNLARTIRTVLADFNDDLAPFADLAAEEVEYVLTVPTTITIDGEKLRIRVSPVPLVQNYLYRLIVPEGALEDVNGIPTSTQDVLGVVYNSAGDVPTVIWAGSLTGGKLIPDELTSVLNPAEYIGIVFNQPIYQNWYYLDGCPITLLDEDNVSTSYDVVFESIRVDEACYALRLTLDKPLDDNSTYTLTIPPGTVKSLLNQPSVGYTRTFSTGALELPGIEELKTFGLERAGESLYGYFRFEKYNNMFEGTHHFQWYLSSDPQGTDIQPVLAADNLTFDIPNSAEYIGKYLWFEVTPQVENGDNLFPSKFGPLGPIQSPFGVNTGLGLLEVKSVVEAPAVPETFLNVTSNIQQTYDILVGTGVKEISVKAVPSDSNAHSWINNTLVAEADNTLVIPLDLDSNLVTVCVTAENDIAQNIFLLNIKRSLENENLILPEGWVEIIYEGNIHPGSVLEGKSYFFDSEFRTEGDDSFKWYRGDENGDGLVLVGQGLIYRVTDEDVGYYLYLEMVPVTSRGIGGDPVLSPGVGPVTSIQNLAIYDLTGLSVKNGVLELINNFNPELTVYERSVGTGTTQVMVSGTAEPAGAIVKVNGTEAPSPVAVALAEGTNPINITVENATLVFKTYYVTINRTSEDIPQASNVLINGTPHSGDTLTGSYQYLDGTETASNYIWYKSDNADGNSSSIVLTGSATYDIGEQDEGSYLFFEVQPINSQGTVGDPAGSEPVYVTSYISSFEPGVLTEAAADNGSLDPSAVVISIAGGTFAEDIVKSDISASHLPAGLDFNITRTDDTHLTINILGNAFNHGNAHDVDNLTFTISQAKVVNAGSDLTTGNINIDFNNAPQPAAPTNPEVDDDANTFGWTNVSGFADTTGYEYSTNNGAGWSDCTANPQPVGNNPFAAGNVQVRVKADSPSGRPAGVVLASDQAFTTPLTKPGEPVLKNHTATWTAVAQENDGYIARLYKDGLFTGNTGEVAHGSPLSYDFSLVMDNPGDYTVTVIACGTGDYGDSPESDPSDPQIVLGTGGVDGRAQFSPGTTDLDLGNNATLDFQAGVQAASGGQITVGGESQNLDNYTGGALNNQDLMAPVNIGDQTVQVGQGVRLESGTDGQPVVLTNSENPGISLSIPDGTAILAGADWDGTMVPPLPVPASGNPPSGFSVGDTVIEVGSPSGILLFDQPVTITLEGVTGTVGYKPAGSDTWVQITQIAGGTYDNPVALEAFGEAYISNGTDTRIITWHLSHFGSLDDRQGRPMGVGGEISQINRTTVFGHWLILIIVILLGPVMFGLRRRS